MVKGSAYSKILDDLTRSRTPAQPDDADGFAAWSALVEVESTLAGLLTTTVHQGAIDRSQLDRIKRSLEQIDPPPGPLADWLYALREAVAAV
ncbi:MULTISPECIES: hypothetical protein [Amycolatopsis]|uniref:Uncharacterized protein n=1 Tax=Amycolatopsis albidoflavus TaxID=102226 RepID=A0ABW5I7C4_9PSEU